MRTSGVAWLGLAAVACGSGPPTGRSAPPPPTAVAPVPTAVPTAGPGANRLPELVLRMTPSSIRGRAPLSMDVDMCRSTDADGDPLQFAYEWAGEGKRVRSDCRVSHTYSAPVRSVAYFCAWDGQPEHLVCRRFMVDVS